MKFILIALAAVSSALLFWFCKHNRYTADTLPTKQIRFGKGGGVVGKETLYTLLENGQLFLSDMGGKPTEADKARARSAKALFQTAETLGLSKLDFKYPGNVYSFIESSDADGKTNRVSWGDQSHPVNPDVQNLFAALMKLVEKK